MSISSVSEIMTVIVSFIPHFLGVSGIALSGILPRVGPGRAWLAMRSRFSFEKTQVSLRVNEIKDIKIALNLKESEGGCLIVTGEKGVGKTCLIDTMAKGKHFSIDYLI